MSRIIQDNSIIRRITTRLGMKGRGQVTHVAATVQPVVIASDLDKDPGDYARVRKAAGLVDVAAGANNTRITWVNPSGSGILIRVNRIRLYSVIGGAFRICIEQGSATAPTIVTSAIGWDDSRIRSVTNSSPIMVVSYAYSAGAGLPHDRIQLAANQETLFECDYILHGGYRVLMEASQVCDCRMGLRWTEQNAA